VGFVSNKKKKAKISPDFFCVLFGYQHLYLSADKIKLKQSQTASVFAAGIQICIQMRNNVPLKNVILTLKISI